ncbi:hypothetical protein ScPMuIL_003928 [Solemya velum]
MATSTSQSSVVSEQILNELATQFMEMVPIRKMKWRSLSFGSEQVGPDVQKKVLSLTIQSPICQRFPPSLSYRKFFMKQLLHKLEDCDAEVCDEVYESYAELLQLREEEDDTLCYKTYTLPSGQTISLQESVLLISQGTTGLSTWEAAEHLAEWSCENSHLFKNRRVLELGCGLGLTGITLCRECSVQSYTFTDCHSQVLYLLSKNIECNFQKHRNVSSTNEQKNTCNSVNSEKDINIMRRIRRQISLTAETLSPDQEMEVSDISLTALTPTDSLRESIEEELSKELADLHLSCKKWEKEETGILGRLKTDDRIAVARLNWESKDSLLLEKWKSDIILAADVVYDKSVLPGLISILKKLLSMDLGNGEKPTAYIASTIRNEDTRDQFFIMMNKEDLSYELIDPPTKGFFHYEKIIPLEILKVVMGNPK